MTAHTPPLWDDFMRLSDQAALEVRFPSGKIAFSDRLLSLLRLSSSPRPENFDQWHELGHPEDHAETQRMLRTLYESDRTALSFTRRFYCGDGIYRSLRLDACILRTDDGAPLQLLGTETDLTPQRVSDRRAAAWRSLNQELQRQLEEQRAENVQTAGLLAAAESELANARSRLASFRSLLGALPLPLCARTQGTVAPLGNAMEALCSRDPSFADRVGSAREGDLLHIEDAWGRTRTFRASLSPLPDSEGELAVLVDISDQAEAEQENLRLRRRLQRGAFRPSFEEELPVSDPLLGTAEPPAEDMPAAESVQAELTALLQSALAALTLRSVSPGLSSRTAQFETLLGAAGRTELTVGVVGITSSGKSTLINAMMGERLLPEETRATTNVTVLCRKGGLRAVDVRYEDGRNERLSGDALTSRQLEELTTERMNPGNERGVARIEWTSPGAALPQGLVLVDTPGLDACELPRHSELVLRRILPTLDIVLYVSSIRSPFKAADIELVRTVLEARQRMILLLTQIDLERDDLEGGRVVLSRAQKLAAYLQELRGDAARSDRPECPVIPISAKLALRYFYDRDSTEWRASNLEPLLRQMASFRERLLQNGIALRAQRAAALLRRTLEDLDSALRDTDGGEPLSTVLRQSARIRELRDAQRWISAEISSVRNEWRRELAPEPIIGRFLREAETIRTPEALRERCLRWDGEWAELLRRMTERMDRAGAFCGEMLARHELSPGVSRPDPIPGFRTELPDLDRYIRHQASEVRTRGWFQGLSFWPGNRRVVLQTVDRELLTREWKQLLTERLEVLDAHLNWWENRMRETVCDPLYEELAREETALEDTKRSKAERELSRSALREAAASLRAVERRLLRLIDGLKLEGSMPAEDEGPPVLPPEPTSASESAIGDEIGENFFSPFLRTFAEQAIQTRFLALPALRVRRRIVLLGLRRHDSLRLLSRLAHDASLTDVPRTPEGREIGEGEWIFCGRLPPAMPHALLRAPSSSLDDMEVLIAPSDAFREEAMLDVDWDDLFGEWLPVVHLDIARVDSGLSDLARSPYASALASVPDWIAASAHGALFATRLPDLVLDVPDRMAAFTRLRGFRGRMDWFVHENYDPRYTDFIALGRQIGADSSDGDLETLLDLWRESGLDFAPPLTEHRLRMALREIRERMRADSLRLLEPEPQKFDKGASSGEGGKQEGKSTK
ncbi:dynamin family protein [uncultured Fretibacterium sp.]|uniref:dynamin family protein n=1 Tax=uncultured Fretibacterium sp. TaxID=1678694 RepID=UPI00262DB3DD|nr:dynamin family protein [uncultured Fretibacterium sp.]